MPTALVTCITADMAALRRNVAALVQPEPRRSFFNLAYRRIGGLRFVKIGRLTVSFSVSRQFKPL